MGKQIFITCPRCGKAYLPGEIYIAKHFLGVPTKVERDGFGKILDFEGIEQDVNETYKCDFCDCVFDVHCDMRFKTEVNEILDSQPYKNKITTGLILDEQ